MGSEGPREEKDPESLVNRKESSVPYPPNRPRVTPPGPAPRPAPRRTLVPRAGSLAAVLALVLLTGCAYFNTFYHAKRFYNQAERARINEERTTGRTSGSSSNLYKQSIDKCEKLIENYPESKWLDDAYLLMAKAYYGKQDYLGADDALNAFMTKFPKSELLPDALFLRGLNQFATEDYENANETWNELLKAYPDYEGREDVEFYLADAQWKSRQLSGAEDAYRAFLTRNPKAKQSTEARLNLGQILLEEKKPDEAETVFRQVADKGKVEEDRIQARILLGQAMEDQSQFDDALSHYRDLEADLDPDVFKGRLSGKERQALEATQKAARAQAEADSLRKLALGGDVQADNSVPSLGDQTDPNARLQAGQSGSTVGLAGQTAARQSYFDRRRDLNNPRDVELAQVMLREGLMLTKLNRPWDAILVFEQVVSEYPNTVYGAEAQYRIGYTQEVDLEDLNSAQRAYALVGNQGPSAFREDAARRAKNLGTVRDLMASAGRDSVAQAAQAASEARFMRAELYLFQQENVDKAVQEYRGIETDYAGTETAAKAGLALAWIDQHSLGDSAGAMAKYTEVAEKYPDSEYGRRAHVVVFGPEPDPQPADYAGPSLAELTSPENLAAMTQSQEKEADLAQSAESTGAPQETPPPVVRGQPPQPGGVTVAQTPVAPPPGGPVQPPAGGSLQDALAATRAQPPVSGGPAAPGAPPGDGTMQTASSTPPGEAGAIPPPTDDGVTPSPSASAEPPSPPEAGGPRPDEPVPAAAGAGRDNIRMREVTPPVATVPGPAARPPSPGVNPESAPGEGPAIPSTTTAATPGSSSSPPAEGVGSPAPRSTGPSEVPAGLYLDPLAVPADGPPPAPAPPDTAAVEKEKEKGKGSPPAEAKAPPPESKKKDAPPRPAKKRDNPPPPKNDKAKPDSTSAKDEP